jgi:uncharacterized protein (DUF1697 family)
MSTFLLWLTLWRYTNGMTKYAAMIRGIGPGNPNMRGSELARVFTSLGFTNARPVITSGNVLFESDIADTARLETMAQEALPRLLGFSREVFIRSQAQLQVLVDANPFAGLSHQNAGKTYLTVTFFKSPPGTTPVARTGPKTAADLSAANLPPLPYHPDGKPFELISLVDGALCCVVDLTTGRTPDLMAWLERQFGKQLTTRTWATVGRLLAKLT